MSVVIVEAAANKRLTTYAHVQADLAGLVSGMPQAQVERYIDQASSRAASYCRRAFGVETVRERFLRGTFAYRGDLSDRGVLLDRDPIVKIKSVTSGGTLVNPVGYEIDGCRLFSLVDGTRRFWPYSELVVEYSTGWLLPGETRATGDTTPDLPADIEQAVIAMVAASASVIGRDPAMRSETVEGIGSTSWATQSGAGMGSAEDGSALAAYRRMIIL